MINTIQPVILRVIQCPDKKGYSIQHNQRIGWQGTTKKHFAWYKHREDAVRQANGLMTSLNK